jgi:arylsulfatase A-like enzyme
VRVSRSSLIHNLFYIQGTMFEGGTRAVSFVHGPRWLDKTSYVNDKLLHITDWMPTLLTLGEYLRTKSFAASAHYERQAAPHQRLDARAPHPR